MRKILPIFMLLMACSAFSFGQTLFELPRSSTIFGTVPAFFDQSIFEFEKNKGIKELVEVSTIARKYRQILSYIPEIVTEPSVPKVSMFKDSNMPIVDLSKGYFSNTPIKEFSKNFQSKMPITELCRPHIFLLPRE